jgi:hypothetical protein
MSSPGEIDDDSDEAPPLPGMLRTSPEEAARAEKAAADKAAADDAANPGVSAGRLKELKDKARVEIDERLKDRRKKRRLMRGGGTSGEFKAYS